MPFDWMRSPPRADFATEQRRQFEREIRERAALLRRLGHDAPAARRRCRENLAWEFERAGGAPLTAADVDRMVDEVYAGGSARRELRV